MDRGSGEDGRNGLVPSKAASYILLLFLFQINDSVVQSLGNKLNQSHRDSGSLHGMVLMCSHLLLSLLSNALHCEAVPTHGLLQRP